MILLDFLEAALSFVAAIAILVTVHEYGHFWVARKCGVKVLTFSIGFGPSLFSWKDKSGTEYVIAAIPLGGYVKMLDENEAEVAEEDLGKAFNRKPVELRMAIAAAGPVANFVLAFFVYWFLTFGDKVFPVPLIEEVLPNSIAEAAGLEAGLEILSVDGRKVENRSDLIRGLFLRLGETGEMVMEVRYQESDLVYEVYLDLEDWMKDSNEPDPYQGLGLSLYQPAIPPIVSTPLEGKPAALAGIQAGDRVLSLDGQQISTSREMVDYINSHPGEAIAFEIERNGQMVSVSITPELGRDYEDRQVGLIGVLLKTPEWPEHALKEVNFGFLEAAARSIREVSDTSYFMVVVIKKMILGQVSVKNLSGPVTIATETEKSIRAGFYSFVTMIALLSISLGVINLLPIPMLDGGHLLYCFAEAVSGRPLPDKVQEFGFQLGLLLIVSLMVFAIYNDVIRLIGVG